MNIRFFKRWFFWLLFSYADGDGNGGGGGGEGEGEGGTGGEGDGDGDGGQNIQANWPENWREQMSGGDEKILAQLGRYSTPTDVWTKARALEQRLSSGELKSTVPFPAEGTDQEKAAWRTENGIPEEGKYELNLADGLVVGEADQTIVDGFMEFAYENNMAPEVVNQSINWYFQNQGKMAEVRKDLDDTYQETNTDELRAEWGDQYRPNVNHITGLLQTAPEEVRDAIMNARMADGNPLGSNAGVLKFLAQLAHEINPVTTLVPGAGGNAASAIEDEIAEIEELMRTDRKKYNADEKLQARYRDLLDARQKNQAA